MVSSALTVRCHTIQHDESNQQCQAWFIAEAGDIALCNRKDYTVILSESQANFTDMLLAEWSSNLVRGTAWLSFAFYIATLYGWLTWHGQVKVHQRLRFCWTIGCLVFHIHVACAFHLVHRWSHRSAWDATQLQGGYGDGVYANYLVLIIWLVDVVWWWLSPQGYLQRSRWVHIAIHGFLLFMWFNAAVVFAHDELASIGILGFTLLAVGVLQWYRRIKRASHPSQESPGQ